MGCSYGKPAEIKNKYIDNYKIEGSYENKIIVITGTTTGNSCSYCIC